MSYATTANMVTRYGQEEMIRLSNPDEPMAVAVDTAIVELALAAAKAEIDPYLIRRGFALVETPLLNQLSLVIARKNLKWNFPATTEKPIWRVEYEDAVRTLQAIAAGSIQPGEAVANAATGVLVISGNGRVLSRSRMAEW